MTDFNLAQPLPQLDKCVELLQNAIEQSHFSAAQFVVSDKSGIRADIAVGTTIAKNHSNPYQKPYPVDHSTLFDVASITKPIATAGLIMQAVNAKFLDLSLKLVNFDSIGVPSWLLGSTIADLLSHHTMLKPWIDLSGSHYKYSRFRSAREPFEEILQESEPRTDGATYCYSDLGYILLGFLIEDLYGDTISNIFANKIAIPLGLDEEMMFCPLHKIEQKKIVATCKVGHQFAQGHPDDSNARALLHRAGHAGLFASARAIDAYVRALFDGSFPCSKKIINEFVSYRHIETPYALGWDRPTGDNSLSGANKDDHVIGHLGFTGCSVWYDLDKKRCITLLTNRTHLSNSTDDINELRRKLYRLCWSDAR